MNATAASVPLRRADDLSRSEQAAIYAVMLIASLGYNYSFILIDYVRPFLVRDAGMTLADTALLYSVQAAGVLIGSFLVPAIIARAGSKAVLIATSLTLAACTFANLGMSGFWPWAVTRFVVGIVLPGCYIASITMLANVFPPRLRGRLLSVNMAMFSISLLTFGVLGSTFGATGWRNLVLVAAVLPLLVAAATLIFLPDDRRFQVYGNDDAATVSNADKGRWREMFAGSNLRLTLTCILLAGLNFSAYQFYSGFITTYLLNVRQFDASLVGWFVTIDGIGTLAGTVMWGIVADRYGRKYNLIGFILAAACIAAFLVLPTYVPLLLAIELAYAVGLSCTNCWAAYFAELFTVRLRPMGTSLFHGGHVVSLFAPLIVAAVAAHAPLAVGMSLAPVSFLLAAILWATLPETLKTGRTYRGFMPDDEAR